MRAVDKWLAGYVMSVLRRPARVPGLKHLMFCVADHYEPFRGGASREDALEAVRGWRDKYPQAAGRFRDADGCAPRHTFFYPQEEYDGECVETLAELCRAGYGEVEIQLHHRHDTVEGFHQKLIEFRDKLRNRHGLLGSAWKEEQRAESREQSSACAMRSAPCALLPAFGFVHGNWALCNSRPDGDWCGVNEELGILADSGCYADFTFPSAPSPTQPRMVNAIYRAKDTGRPRAADKGREVRSRRSEVRGRSAGVRSPISDLRSLRARGEKSNEHSAWSGEHDNEQCISDAMRHAPCPLHSSLMLITGPLALNWRLRKWGLLPRLENAELSGANPPLPARIDLWARQWIHVEGRPDWVFVKVHTHGCMEENMRVLMGDEMRSAHRHLCGRYNDGKEWALHYVTAREMYNIVRAAEDGMPGRPGEYRDYEVMPPESA